MESYDVIVVGAGLGGLAAGAKLSKEGKRVLLIEQRPHVGGYASTEDHDDFVTETSLRAIDGPATNDSKTIIWNDLDIFNTITLIKLTEYYRFIGPFRSYTLPSSLTDVRNKLIYLFPQDWNGIHAYFRVCKKIQNNIEGMPAQSWKQMILSPFFPLLYRAYYYGCHTTMGAFLERKIKSEDLKLILAAPLLYFGDDPHTHSLLSFALSQQNHLSGGSYYIDGGSQKLSDHLASVIEAHGGRIITGHMVTHIFPRHNNSTVVIYASGNAQLGGEVKAESVIVNASIPVTVNKLLPSWAVKKKYLDYVNSLSLSPSLLSVSIRCKTPPIKLGNKHYTTFVYDNVKKLSEIQEKNHASFDVRPFAFIDYSQIDSGLHTGDMSQAMIVVCDYPAEWDNIPDTLYEEKKEEVACTLIRRLEKIVPGISGHIIGYTVKTARTLMKETGNAGGSVNGFAQTPEQTGYRRISMVSPIKNLFYASAWTFPGGGFTGAIVSGYLAALEVLNKEKKKKITRQPEQPPEETSDTEEAVPPVEEESSRI
jgi:all-trans-retinol 13,14-reductase